MFQNQSELQAKPNDELEELAKNLKQSKEKVKAVQDELDSCTDEKLVLKKEVRELRDSLRDLNKQIEGQIRDAALEKKHSDDSVHLEHKVRQSANLAVPTLTSPWHKKFIIIDYIYILTMNHDLTKFENL